MDLSKLDPTLLANEGVFMPLRHPTTGVVLKDETTGEDIGLYLYGKDSDRYQQYQHRVANRRFQENLTDGKLRLTAEELEEDTITGLAQMTCGFQHIELDGSKPKFTIGAARKLYTRFLWIREQAEKFIQDRANFLGKSLNDSLPVESDS